MTDDINSRARQLLVDIGLKEPTWNPPPGHAEYDALVASVADHLRQVAAEAGEAALRDSGKGDILPLRNALAREKLKDATLAEATAQFLRDQSAVTSLRALLADAGEALKPFAEESEAYGLRHDEIITIRATPLFAAAKALASIQTALRDASPTMGKPK